MPSPTLAPAWIKVDPGSTSLRSSKLLIISAKMKYDIDIEGAKMR